MAFIKSFSFLNCSNSSYGKNGEKQFLSDSETIENNFFTAVYRKENFNYPKFFKMDSASKAGFLCAELIKDGFPEDKNNFSVIMMNNFSSSETDKNFEKTISDTENYYPSPSVFVYTLPNIMTGEICIRHGFKGESSFYVFEKFLPEEFVNIVGDSLEFCDYALAGWSESGENSGLKSVVFLVSKTSESEKIFDKETVEKIYRQC